MQDFIFQFFGAALLGLIQGITEFLPVSSTGHLIIGQRLLGLDQTTYGLPFDMMTNLGTVAALMFYFRHDLLSTFSALRFSVKHQTEESRLAWRIIGITGIVGAIGYLLKSHIASDFRAIPIVSAMLILFGAYMLLAEYVAKKLPANQNPKPIHQWLMGIMQAVALVPGVSRSGVTISTGLLTGMTRTKAARFSFLLSAPITSLAVVASFSDAASVLTREGIFSSVSLFYVIGFITAALSGYWAIAFLLKYLEKASLAVFAYYRFALALILLVFLVI